MGGEVRGVVAGTVIATMALAGCTSAPRNLGPVASEGCLTEAKPSDEVLVGDLDGDGEADEVHVYEGLGWLPPSGAPRLGGAIVMADRRLIGLTQDERRVGQPVALLDADADGTDELLLDAGGNTAGFVALARLEGCTVAHVPIDGDPLGALGWYATGNGCAPDCGMGIGCVPGGEGRELVTSEYWVEAIADVDGDGEVGGQDTHMAERAEDLRYRWTVIRHRLTEDGLTTLGTTSGEGSVDEAREQPVWDGIICDDVEVALGDSPRRPGDRFAERGGA